VKPREALHTEEDGAPVNAAAGASPRRESTRPQPAPREGILTSLLNLAKRGGKAAPIEERTAAATTRVASLSGETRRSVEGPASGESSENPAERASPPPADVSADVITRPIPTALSPGFANAAITPRVGAPSTTQSYGEKLQTTAEESVGSARADVAEQGRRAVADVVSRTATGTEVEIGRVLARAGTSYRLEEQQWIVDAARRSFGRNALPVAAKAGSGSAATPLKDEARRAFFAQRDPDRALDLYVQAFGADPYDAETAGNLASLYLRVRPLQAHAARQLAMHAIAVASAQSRAPRVQDWSTFAVASALVGHDDDATHALFVAAALTANLPNTCRTALSAVAIYGDRMRVPVESMLLRMHAQGRDRESPYCSFPPRWASAGRFY
jgi:hypothetical protein